jgi:hypothetical protein
VEIMASDTVGGSHVESRHFLANGKGCADEVIFGVRLPREWAVALSLTTLTSCPSHSKQASSLLRVIEDRVFDACLMLPAISIPPSVQSLGRCCFVNCRALSSVVFEAGSELTTIVELAFWKCVALQSICLPKTLQSMGNACFENCEALTTVTFEPGCALARPGIRRLQ